MNNRNLKINKKVPDFSLPDKKGKNIRLSDFKEKNIVLVFYRGDWCPFCKWQLKNFRKDYPKFKELNSEIIAISIDSVEKNIALSKKLELPFPILSDPTYKAIKPYRVVIDKKKGFSQPAVFIIDKTGYLQFKFIGKGPIGRPKNKDLLKALENLNKLNYKRENEK